MPSPGKANRLRFGKFLVDLASGEVFCEGAKVAVQDKPFQILALLIQKPKELVSRSEIIRTVWPDTFVEGDLCLNVAVRRLRTALQDDPSHPQYVETVGSHGYRFIAAVHGLPASGAVPPSRDRPRLAVFPLKSFVSSNNASLPPSMTEQVIVQLRRSNAVPIIITPEFTTERTPKGKSVVGLCRQVSADYVLVGAVSEAGQIIRIAVRLLNCHAQSCVWAESYAMPVTEIFSNEEEVARKIVAAVTHAIPMPLRPSDLQLVNPGAHEKYLQGSALLSRLTESGIVQSVALFEEAVHESSQFAIAWAALANAHAAHARMGIVPPRKAFPEVRRCAEKALEIEELAEARAALANYRLFYEHDFHAAEADLVRALAIDPGCALALGAYAQLLTIMGTHEDAIAMMRRACDLDPFSGYSRVMLGWALYYAEEYEAASSQLRQALELDPSLWLAHSSLGMVLEELNSGDPVTEFRTATEDSGNSALARAHLAYGLARSGDSGGAAGILDSLLKLRHKKYFSAYWIAVIYTGLNEPSEALKWMANAKADHCCWLVLAQGDPKLKALRSDVRFRTITESTRVLSS